MTLTQCEKKFADVLPDAVVAIDETGQILWCNNIAQTILNIDRAQLALLNLQNLIYFSNFKTFINQEPYYAIESYLLMIHETFISVKIIYHEHNTWLLLLRDITQLHFLEKIRQDFVANVSHELRTPLTVIHGYLELLLSEDHSDARPWKKMLTHMYQQGLRMEKLVEDLLLLSRLESQPVTHPDKPIMVGSLLKSICNDAKILSGARSHIINLCIDDGLRLVGNESELHAAFSNIVFNAVHYTPAGGDIDVIWEYANQEATLNVRDTGIGILPQDLPRLTERFYRVDKARSRESGGTGLGLAIVKHVLIRHGARLEIESIVGSGSSFKCIFPSYKLSRRRYISKK